MTQLMTFTLAATAEVPNNFKSGVLLYCHLTEKVDFCSKYLVSQEKVPVHFRRISNRVGTDKCSSIKVEDRIFD